MNLKGYTNIPDWMLTLDLDVYETIILAVIFGFSQDRDSTFSGSQKYLAIKARCSKRKVANALVKLVSRKLIEKIDTDVRGIHLCEYKATRYCTMCKGDECGAIGGDECGATNNIDKDNIDIYTLSIKGNAKFKKPSLDEIRDYCLSRSNSVDPEQFYNFYESKGWMVGKSPMKDWKASVRTWEKRDTAPAPKRRSPRRESVLEHNLKVMDEMYGTDIHKKVYGDE